MYTFLLENQKKIEIGTFIIPVIFLILTSIMHTLVLMVGKQLLKHLYQLYRVFLKDINDSVSNYIYFYFGYFSS